MTERDRRVPKDDDARSAHAPGGDASGALTPSHAIVIYLKGLAMGSADAVPGVSGGTIALIVGIYDRLVTAITKIDPRGPLQAITRNRGERLEALWRELRVMDAPFLMVLGLGVLTGIAIVSQILELALTSFRLHTFGFFFGLIGASAIVLWADLDVRNPRISWIAGLTGVLVAFVLVGEVQATLGHSPIVVFVAGTIAVSAMLLPGVSGSFLLLALGQLTFMARTLNGFLEAILASATGGDPGAVVAPGMIVVTFGTGALIGLLTIARVVRTALERNREVTVVFLVGLMVGALRLPIEEVRVETGGALDGVIAVIAASVGVIIVVVLDQKTDEIGVG